MTTLYHYSVRPDRRSMPGRTVPLTVTSQVDKFEFTQMNVVESNQLGKFRFIAQPYLHVMRTSCFDTVVFRLEPYSVRSGNIV